MDYPYFYTSLGRQLSLRVARAVLSQMGVRAQPLREHLRRRFEQSPGLEGSFIADPVFESLFGWQSADCTMDDLADNLLHPRLVDAMDRPPEALAQEYRFPRDRAPYRHQLEAWRALGEPDTWRSVLVSSGTGSGKTECFLVPILDDLAREAAQRGPLSGVRALFLYPLNALINSQRDRLRAWTGPFNGRLRFCLYNGETQEQVKSQLQKDHPEEVLSRQILRDDPPPILVTNSTMLEYMLVRNRDVPIIQASQGRLRWIVLDEAHTYIGSQAAELSLLLRRVLHAFGTEAGQVHFVATSATLSSADARQTLQHFLADIAGVDSARVTVITGERAVPELDPNLAVRDDALPQPVDLRTLAGEDLYRPLAANGRIRQLRDRLIHRPLPLSQATEVLFGRADPATRVQTLELLDHCARARRGQEALLPLRGHFFQRTQSGIWACVDAHCPGRDDWLQRPGWGFGRVYLERRERCADCKAPVYELVLCGDCGSHYLIASEDHQEEGKSLLKPRLFNLDEDEFQQELEPPEEDGNAEGEEGETPDLVATRPPRLLCPEGEENIAVASLDRDSGELDYNDPTVGLTVRLRLPDDDNRLTCTTCGCHDGQRGLAFRPIRLGAPFLLGVAIPTLLEHMPAVEQYPNDKPFGGRRLITFSDSRQGTARFAVKAQQDAERNYIRSLLYHTLADRAPKGDDGKRQELQTQIEALAGAAQNNRALQPLLDKLQAELQSLSAPGPGRLSWQDAVETIHNSQVTERWLSHQWREFTDLSGPQLARLCLYREFFRRPRRQNSLETLGLVALDYPALRRIQHPPAAFLQHKLTLADWQAFLRVVLDYYVRGTGVLDIPKELLRWLGIPARQRFLLGPKADKSQRNQTVWPRAQTGRRSRLVRLLCQALDLNLEVPTHREAVDEILLKAWNDIRPLLQRSESGSTLPPDQLELVQVTEAWLCPVTHRVLPVVFAGLTPYLPLSLNPNLLHPRPIPMPRLPLAFWEQPEGGRTPRREIETWLEEDPQIQQARQWGIWPELSDRIAAFSPYFRVVEHSAQLNGHRLQQLEKRFKDADINLLSCSTTMEMGVDIGGLTAVAMNNAPPGPANFLQRAGRAGRRGETTAASLTLCKSSPHGDMVFRNPLWPFDTAIHVPRVSLQSERIVCRHLNALLLGLFLKGYVPDEIPRLTSGWFFGRDLDSTPDRDTSSPYRRFLHWCDEQSKQPGTHLKAGVERLVRRTALEGNAVGRLLQDTKDHLEALHEHWSQEVDAFDEERQGVRTAAGNTPAEKAIQRQLERILKEYLLADLTTRGFLPGYGFPVGVVPFVTTTWEELQRHKQDSRQEREDNRARFQGYPSRELPVAVRDYAPGTDTVVDGRVYRCAGVTLNWHIPPGSTDVSEIQSLGYAWRCQSCGANGTPRYQKQCPQCHSTNLVGYDYLQPAGFAVDLFYSPHNDVTTPQYIPVREPLISLEGAPWVWLPRPALGRYRYSRQGRMFERSDGLHNFGYALCLRCGRADSEVSEDRGPLPDSLQDHKRLRGGKGQKEDSPRCEGNDDASWAIKRHLRLGVVNSTDILELQLRHPDSGETLDRTTAYSLAAALRQVVAEHLGIDEREIGCSATATRDPEGFGTHSIVLYDQTSGGAGYVSAVITDLPDLLRRTRRRLDCPRGCDSACHGCLLSYDTQHHLEHLDRHRALALLTERFLDGLELPAQLQVFGSDTRLEMEPLALALARELQQGAGQIRLHLGGDPNHWEPLAWRLRDDLLRWATAGQKPLLTLPRDLLSRLPLEVGNELAALLEVGDLEMRLLEAPLTASGGAPLVAELGSAGRTVSWAATHPDALAPSPQWGSGEGTIQFLHRIQDRPLDDLSHLPLCRPEQLRRTPGAMVEIQIADQLDGPLQAFGSRFWSRVLATHPTVQQRLEGAIPLSDVRYQDRYIKSPLTLGLFYQVIKGLQAFDGGLKEGGSVTLETAEISPGASHHPRWVFNDWCYDSDRLAVFEELLRDPGLNSQLLETRAHDLPHARELTLIWQDGVRWVLRLDQGFGYWKLPRHLRLTFPFDRTPQRQGEWLQTAAVEVVAQDTRHPTYLYLGKLH